MLNVEGTGIVRSLRTFPPKQPDGQPVNALFIESVRPNRNGELIKNSLPVVTFGDLPAGVDEDSHLRLEGFVNRRGYTNDDGHKIWVTEVVATSVETTDPEATLRPLLVSGQVTIAKLNSHAAKTADGVTYNDLFVTTTRPTKTGELKEMKLPITAFGDDLGVDEGDTAEVTGVVSRFERSHQDGSKTWQTDVIVHDLEVVRDRSADTALEATGLER